MVQMLDNYNNSYCYWYDTKTKLNNKTYEGTLYRLCNKLTDEQKAIFELFPNVIVGKYTNVQAPDLNSNYIFLLETSFETPTKYIIDGEQYTPEELRIGYRIITGLDNDTEFTDNEIYLYLLEEFERDID